MAGVDVGTAYLTVVPSMKGFASKLQSGLGGGFADAGKRAGGDAAKGFGGSFTSGIKSVVGPAAALVAGLGAVNFLKDSVGEAREAQKVGALTENVIKQTGGAAKISADQVGQLSTAISNKTGIDDEAIQSGANLLLTFKNVKNEVGQGSNVFDRATQAATDLSAAGFGDMTATSKQLGKALNDPVKGISALSRAGVTFTDQQKEQIKTLTESGDVLGAQKIILGEVESQVGGAAAASSTAGEKMKVAFGNLKEQLGTAVLPVVDKFATTMTTKVIPGISGVIDILTKGDFTKAFGEAFNLSEDSPAVAFLFKVRDGVKEVFGILKNNDANLDATLLSPMEKFGVFLLKARDLSKVVFDQIVFGAQGVARAFSGEGVTSDGFIGFMERVGVAARKVFDFLKEILPQVWESAKRLWPSIKEIAVQLLAASQSAGVSTFQLLKVALEALPGILDAILPLLESVAKWMGENKTIVQALVVALGLWKVATLAVAGVQAIQTAAIVAASVAQKAVAVVTGLWTAAQWLLNVALTANPIGLIVVGIAALIGVIVLIATKTTWFQTIWEYTWGAIQTIVQFTWNNVLQPIINAMITAFSTLAGWVANLLDALSNVPGFGWAKDAADKLRAASDAASALAASIQKIPDNKTVTVHLKSDAETNSTLFKLENLPKNAAGTDFWRGGPTWVGEEGPELLNLPRGSQILSNRDSVALLSAPTSSGPTVEQRFFGDILAHDYNDFTTQMLRKGRLAAIGER